MKKARYTGYVAKDGHIIGLLPDFERLRHIRLYFEGKYCLSGGVTFHAIQRHALDSQSLILYLHPPYDGGEHITHSVVIWRKKRP